jgi:methanogenic corrinoid protein MtbC1
MPDNVSLLADLKTALFELRENDVYALVRKALQERLEPVDIINKALTPGMVAVGEEFEEHRYYLPELLLCAEIFKAGVDIVRPAMQAAETEAKGTIVFGTIQGDIHDIGKNIVRLMLELAGIKVHDLGFDVPYEKFLEKIERNNAEIVAASAMITSTVPGLKKLADLVKRESPGTAVMIGGAPVTESLAEEYGADGFAPDCISAVKEAKTLIDRVRARRSVRKAGEKPR